MKFYLCRTMHMVILVPLLCMHMDMLLTYMRLHAIDE